MLSNLIDFKPYRDTPSFLRGFKYILASNLQACINLIFEVDTFQYPMLKAGGLDDS